MAEVKWVRITTDMFDNRKIKHLRKLPDGNNIVLIWVMLLTMAGRCNSGGMIFLTENIPYTPRMLADELGFDESVVQLALEALVRLNMISSYDGNFISIAGWEEYQNVEGLDKIREQTRNRVAKHREMQRLSACSVTRNVTVTQSNATDIDKEEDLDKEKRNKREKDTPARHKYGEYKNVLLTDEDLAKLKAEFSDWEARIERLSSYIAQSGKSYKNHLATIRNWAKKDKESGKDAGADQRGAESNMSGAFGTWL